MPDSLKMLFLKILSARITKLKFCVASLLITNLLLSPISVSAAPSGNDLLQACTESVRNGFDTMKGKMCTWYVTPCDCNIDKTIPQVCLSESVTTESLAATVIAGLTEKPELQQESAARAAALILSEKYPCTEEEKL